MSDKIVHEWKSFSVRNYYIFVPSKIDNGTVLIMSFPWRKPVFISTQTLTHAVFQVSMATFTRLFFVWINGVKQISILLYYLSWVWENEIVVIWFTEHS